MKTIIYNKGSKSVNVDKIITMQLIIPDENGHNIISNNKEIKNITKIPEDILKICKIAYITCKVESIDEPIYLIKSDDINNVINEFVTIRYFLNQPEHTEVDYSLDYEDGELDEMSFINEYLIQE